MVIGVITLRSIPAITVNVWTRTDVHTWQAKKATLERPKANKARVPESHSVRKGSLVCLSG